MTQLALRFPGNPSYREADLLPNPAQDEARLWLARTATWPLRRLVLCGAPGSGKTHLLHAWAETSGAALVPALPPTLLPGTWPAGPLAIDGIEAVDEAALLHLLNAASEARHPVLLAANQPPQRLPIRLPDLASRLRATTAITIGPAPDDFLAMLFARLLAEHQLRLPPALAPFLLARLPRTPAAIRDAVQRLEAGAALSGRSLTRPRAAALLGLDDISA